MKVQINDRFFENYEYLFQTWPFKMILTASTSDFQSPTNLKSTQGMHNLLLIVESLRKYVDCLEELLKITEVVRSE